MRKYPFLPLILAAILISGISAFAGSKLSAEPVAVQDIREDMVSNPSSADSILPGGVSTVEDEAARESAEESSAPGKKKGTPAGLEIIVTFFVIVILYLVISSIIARRKSREEIVIHRKDAPPDPGSGSYSTNRAETGGFTRKAPPSRDPGTAFPQSGIPGQGRPAPSSEQDSAPGQSKPTRKTSLIPTIIFAIVFVNILRRCLMKN